MSARLAPARRLSRVVIGSALLVGLAVATGWAAPPALPASIPAPSPLGRPALVFKDNAPPKYASDPEVLRTAVATAAGAKRRVPSTLTNPPVIGTLADPGPYVFDLYEPFLSTIRARSAEAVFRSVQTTAFDQQKPNIQVRVRIEGGSVYVVDCPIAGGPTPIYRMTVLYHSASTPIVVESRASPMSHAATADGTLFLELQGYDATPSYWTFRECRVRRVPYD